MPAFRFKQYRALLLVLPFLLISCGGGGENNDDDIPVDLASIEDTVISVPEDTPTETIIGALNQAADADLGGAVITLSGDLELVNIDNQGQISLKPGFMFDYETKKQYLFTITVEKEGLNTVTATLQIDVTDVIEGPRLGDVSFTVDENLLSGTIIGSIIPQGVATNAFFDFYLSGEGSDNFDITSNGELALPLGVGLDAEQQSLYSLTLQGTNSANERSSMTLTIHVNHVVTVPFLSNSSFIVNENSPAGTEVGNITINNDGGSDITVFELTGLGAGAFAVNAQGLVTVSGLVTLDHEVQTSYGLKATATNIIGQSAEVNINIKVADLDIAPTLADSILTLEERSPVGSYVGAVSIVDVGESPISQFSLTGDFSSLFSIDTNGVITVVGDIDAATRSYYSLMAKASNQQGDSNQVDVTINIQSLLDTNPPKQLQHLVHSNPVKYDFAGNALAILDEQLYVGIAQNSYAKESNPDFLYSDAGRVAIFDNISGDASAEFKLKMPDNSIALYNKFGSSVSALNHASKGLLVGVGAEGSNCPGQSMGELWIYKKIDDSTYYDRLAACLSAEESDGASGLGHTLALGEDYFISGSQSGVRGVFLFSYDALGQFDGSTGFISKIRPSNLSSGSNFGENISLQDNYFIASASNDSGVSGIEVIENAGAVYLYKYNPTSKSAEFVRRIQASDFQEDDYFGLAVSISGNYIAVANKRNAVYLYKLNDDDSVTELSKVTHAHTEVDSSPMASIVFKDNLLIAGVPSDTRGFAGYAGSVQIYALENNDLVYKHTLEAEFIESSATYGNKLAFDGRYLAVSAPAEDNSSISATGAVYVYDVKPETKPKLTNYEQDILIKDNADFNNIYEFEADSPQGGPFTYEVSGQDSDKFTFIDNQLLALSAFDVENPEDDNGDNIYQLIITVTDSSNTSRSYALQVTVLQHQVLYYIGEQTSSVDSDESLSFGNALQIKNGRLFTKEFYRYFLGENRSYAQLYQINDQGLLDLTGLLTPPSNSSFGFAMTTALSDDFLAVTSHDEFNIDNRTYEYDIEIYPILSDGSFGTPKKLPQSGNENMQRPHTMTFMGNHLIVEREDDYNDNISPVVDEPEVQVIYSVNSDGSAQRHGKIDATDITSIKPSQHFMVNYHHDTDQYQLSLLDESSHQFIIKPDVVPEDIQKIINVGVDNETGFDYVLSDQYLLNQYSVHKLDSSTGDFSFSSSIDFSEYGVATYFDVHTTGNLLIAADEGVVYIFKFDLADDSLRYLGKFESDHFYFLNSVEQFGEYLYFSQTKANNEKGAIYIYELDSNL